eukprot:7469101-Pyramimonas_sp.AAC.1
MVVPYGRCRRCPMVPPPAPQRRPMADGVARGVTLANLRQFSDAQLISHGCSGALRCAWRSGTAWRGGRGGLPGQPGTQEVGGVGLDEKF